MSAQPTIPRGACRIILALALVLVGPMSVGSALAVTPKEREAALRFWDRGMTAHQAKDWAQAAELWGNAYLLDPRPEYLWALARDEQRAGELDAAKRHYERFLALEDADLPESMQAEVDKRREQARGYIAEIEATLRARQVQETAKEAALEEAEKSRREALEAASRGEAARASEAKDAVADGAGATDDDGLVVAKQQTATPGPNHTLAWGVIDGGIAFVAGGIGATAWALSSASRMERFSQPDATQVESYQARFKAARSDLHTAEALYIVGYTVGAAAIITGVILLVTDEPEPATRPGVQVGTWLTPAGAGVTLGLGW